MAMLSLRIWLFGQFELAWGDTPLPIPRSSVARSLLAYLVVHHDRVFPRDVLAGTFWPERPDAAARRALSQALWQIRQSLRPAVGRLTAERDSVAFLLHPGDWLDVADFEEGVHSSATQLLEQAVTLYRADLLEDIYDDWALLERERLRELYLGALERLTTLHKQRGDYEQALTCAQRLAAADPLREATHQELLRLYHLLGRTRTALEQFATLRKLLAQELGVSPSPTTVALYQEIAATLEEAVTPHLPVASPPPPLLRDLAHLPFVGRTSERAALIDGLQAAIQGRGRLALVEGAAGVGKTRLVSEIVADARWRGFQVGLGKVDPLAAAAPYQLLRDALSPLLTPLRIAQLAELVEPLGLSAIAPLFPTIAEHLPELPPLAPLKPHEEWRRLGEGFMRCLTGLASISPLLLVLEDLHWADEATLVALPRLAPRLPASRVFLILTYRTAEARERAAVWEALSALDRDLPLLRLRLPSFERAEAVTLIQRALGMGRADTQAEAFAQHLQDETGGNGLFLVETLKSLVEQGTLAPSPDGGWVFPSGDLPLPTSASVRELIGERLARLPLPLHTVLEWIAVLGDDASFPVLSHVSDTELAALLPTLQELVQRGFLVETEARYRFEHDCIQEIVYQTIAPERRRTLHRRAGTVLEELRPERVEPLAHHFSLGEVWDKAADYNRQAGDRAKAVYAGDEAISYYTRALEAWSFLRSPDQSLKIELHHARGEVCQETGQFDQAEADFQSLYDLAGEMGDKANQARALNHQSYLQFQRGRFHDTVELARQALALAKMDGLQLEIATSLFNQANALRNMGHYRQAIELYEQAASIFEKLDDQVRLADCLNRMGYAWLFTSNYTQAQLNMARGLAIRRRLDERVGMAYSLINLASLYYYKGEFSKTWAAAQEALEVASATGDLYGEDGALSCLGDAAMEQGSLDQAVTFFQRAIEIARKIGDRGVETYALSALGRVQHYRGNLKQAERTLEQYFDLAPAGAERHQHPIAHAYLAWLFLDTNRDEKALVQARTGLEIAQKTESSWPIGLIQRAMGEITARSCAKGPSPDPAFHFEESIRILREIGAQAELARSLTAYGLYLNHSTNADEIQRGVILLDEAKASFQQLGMVRDLARLKREVAACLRPGQIRVRLPATGVPTGRLLRDDEYVEVIWTLSAPEDDESAGKAARRRHRILRLLREAGEQSAAPTVERLAETLKVGERTIKRDLAALRAAGHEVRTRGSHR